MNNAKLVMDSYPLTEEPVDRQPHFREREGELVRIIDALQAIQQTAAWDTMRELVFEGMVSSLERQLSTEAKKDAPNTNVLARINGQLLWATKFADLGKLTSAFRQELLNVRKQLNYGEEGK